MKTFVRITCLIGLCCFVVFCNNNEDSKEKQTILVGTTTILVDETFVPIIEDQIAVFESEYDAKISLKPRSEAEAMQALLKDSAQIVILPRKLSPQETDFFKRKKITPKETIFATDAVVFIKNKSSNDTLIDLADVADFMKGKQSGKIKGLVFDNPNSSTMRVINKMSGVSEPPEKGIYSFGTNQEVIEFVSKNEGMIGVIGLNWLSQPTIQIEKMLPNIDILSVKAISGSEYYYPNQNNLNGGKYPLARDLYIVNVQGSSGLGIGFASFIAGERGQRIILKSGLLPVRIPGRNILIRNKIETKNTN